MNMEQALNLLRSGPDGVQQWNQPREVGEMVPCFFEADLSKLDLSMVFLWDIDLTGANLQSSNLCGAYFNNSNLRGANLSHANLCDANLRNSNLRGTNLSNAKLKGTNFSGADLSGADLCGAELCNANLRGVNLRGVNLKDTDLSGSVFTGTVIACDLSNAMGLDSVNHLAPSIIDVNSLLCSKGELPEKFLRGCGLQEEEIVYFRSRVNKAIRFYTCFISYSTADEDFVTLLHNDLQAAGIRCWKWDHDARTGKNLWGEIDFAIRKYDKLILIASEASLKSPAVGREIERAIVQEDERTKLKQADKFPGNVDVLFPVRLDNYIFEGWQHERKVDVTKKVVADARGWKSDHQVYARVRDKLISDLKVDPKTEY